MKIAFFDTKPYDKNSFEQVNKEFNYDIKYFKSHLTKDNIVLAKDMDAICIFVNDQVDKNIIDTLYQYGVKLIALRCSGYNNVDLKAAKGKIKVVRVPAYSPNAVAEHTIAMIMALNRKTHKAYIRTRETNFTLSGLMGFDMANKTAGIIGTGKIGQIVMRILKGFGMNIIAYDKFPNHEIANEIGFEYTSLDNIFTHSDIISLHCPLTKETEHIINKKTISRMKDGVMIINTGRGALINTKNLIAGLKKRKIGYAGLDVYEEESDYFFEDYSDNILTDDILARLLTFNNVLVTSHQGFFTREALSNIAMTTMNNIRRYENKEDIENEVCFNC